MGTTDNVLSFGKDLFSMVLFKNNYKMYLTNDIVTYKVGTFKYI